MEGEMLKTTLTVLTTAAVCFAIAATTGFAAHSRRTIQMEVGDVLVLKAGNIQCQAVSKSSLACGPSMLSNAKRVYFTPHEVSVVSYNRAGTKYSVIYSAKR